MSCCGQSTMDDVKSSNIPPLLIPPISQIKNILPKYPLLQDILSQLPENDRRQLFLTILGVRSAGHVYLNKWNEADVDSSVLDRIVDIVRRYESNGLQLNGYGCWLLERIIVRTSIKISDSAKYSEASILELILRIFLEHPVYNTCVSMLYAIVRRSDGAFTNLCQIAVRIVDELPDVIPPENFSSFFSFVIGHVKSRKSDILVVETGFKVLSSLTPRVQGTQRSRYFTDSVSDLLHQCARSSSTRLRESVFLLLSSLCPLNPTHPCLLYNHGFHSDAINAVLSLNDAPDYVSSAALLFLSHLSSFHRIAIEKIRVAIPSSLVQNHLEVLFQLKNFPATSSVLDYVVHITARPYLLVAPSPVAQGGEEEEEDLERILLCYLHLTSLALAEPTQEATELSSILISMFMGIKRLCRSWKCQSILLRPTSKPYRTIIISWVRERVESVSMGRSELDMMDLLSVDILLLLTGSADIKFPCDDHRVQQLLADAKKRFCPECLEREREPTVDQYPLSVSVDSLDMITPISQDLIVDFVAEWETVSSHQVLEQILTLLVVSRVPQGLGPNPLLAVQGMNLPQLAEILIELLTDDRHAVSDTPGMTEKCVQLLTDICSIDAQALRVGTQALKPVLELLYAAQMSDSMVYTCLRALIALAADNQNHKIIVNSICKIDSALSKVGLFNLIPLTVTLCIQIIPGISKINLDEEVVLVGWIMRCIQSKLDYLILLACKFICDVGKVHKPIIFRAFSRNEIEKPLFAFIKSSTEVSTVISVLRALNVVAANFNPAPFWFSDFWVWSWNSNQPEYRVITDVGFMEELSHLYLRFQRPYNFVILSYCVKILLSILASRAGNNKEEYRSNFFGMFLPDVAHLLSVITLSYTFVTREDLGALMSGAVFPPLPEDAFSPLLTAELQTINEAHELCAAAVVSAVHILVLSGPNSDPLLYFRKYEILFHATPLCEAIIYLMIQLPGNAEVQIEGLIVLRMLIQNGICASTISIAAPKILIGAMVGFSDDSRVHLSFCAIVQSLANLGDLEKNRLVESGVFKWLYVIIKVGSTEIAPYACVAVSSICDNQERAEAISKAGICRSVIWLMNEHHSILRVQMEGLRAVAAMCRSHSSTKQIKDSGGEETIARARKFLHSVLQGSADGRYYPVLEISCYRRADVEEVYELSAPARIAANCSIS